MANFGITLGGFAQGYDKARGRRQQDQLIELNKQRMDMEQGNDLLARVQSNVSDLVKNSDEIMKTAVENASVLNRTPQGQKALQSMLLSAKAGYEKAGQLGGKAGIEIPDFNAKLQAFQQIAESTPTPEQAAEQGREQTFRNAEAEAQAAVIRARTMSKATGVPTIDILEKKGELPGDDTFQTEAGKAIADFEMAKRIYGPQSEQANALKEVMNAGEEEPSFADESGVRKEFTQLSKDFISVRDAFAKVRNSASDPSPAGDLAMIFNFMKMLDPQSVVREGEFATAQNAEGIPGRVRNLYNRALSGERLNPTQREDFLNQAFNTFTAQMESQKRLENQFSGIANRKKLAPENVVVDFIGDELRNFEKALLSATDVAEEFGLSLEDVEFTMQEENITAQELAQRLKRGN